MVFENYYTGTEMAGQALKFMSVVRVTAHRGGNRVSNELCAVACLLPDECVLSGFAIGFDFDFPFPSEMQNFSVSGTL